ncbi:MAG: serine dehydratase subunit alpha family protein [Deltaproteobacteria bacterium]|nr:serine dehydratase subunit alpha family protein [Candidatus Zymogenaceae bacterium]
MTKTDDSILTILKRYVVPALGCTEPVSIALAAAAAARALGCPPESMTLTLDRYILRNAIAVGVPGTDSRGVAVAAALGAFAGDPDRALMVIEGADPRDVARAKKFAHEKRITIAVKENAPGIYIKVEITGGGHTASAAIEGTHEHLVAVERNGDVLFVDEAAGSQEDAWFESFSDLTIADAERFARSVPLSDIEYMAQGLELTARARDVGLEHKAGLGYATDLTALCSGGFIVGNVIARARVDAAAASGARMAGLAVPVLSSFGSGNQGIVINAAVGSVARELGYIDASPPPDGGEESNGTDSSDRVIIKPEYREIVVRSLALAHIVTGITKVYTGILSPYCEAAVTTAGAASAGCVFLMNGTPGQMANAFQLTVAATEGVFCDGAKESCALKTSMGAGAAVENAYLSMKDNAAPRGMGIVGDDFLGTLRNFRRLAKEIRLDDVILKMLMERDNGPDRD